MHSKIYITKIKNKNKTQNNKQLKINSGIDKCFEKKNSLSNNLMLYYLVAYFMWKHFFVHENIFLLVGIIFFIKKCSQYHIKKYKKKSAIKNNDGYGKKIKQVIIKLWNKINGNYCWY